ncbi:MAG: HigA family addiction module antitoxin [Patescibacteria group bacterium]|jgi:HTH-type transcriptional regulator/antitoxin HigA
MAETNFQPDKAIHPGKTLQETLDVLGMSQIDLAQRTELTTKTINEIIQGKNPITSETAMKLANVFGMDPNFWSNLQKNYDAQIAKLREDEHLKEESEYLIKFKCYKKLEELGFVPKVSGKKEKVKNLLNFFGISSLDLVCNVQQVAFRKHEQKKLEEESLAAWLRCGELEASKIDTAPFDEKKIQNSLQKLRGLTLEKAEAFESKLINECASFGVAVVFIPYFKNTYVCGATRWINPEKAMIQLSLKGGHSDIFWFTFFHELGHLLKHGKKGRFIEFEKNKIANIEEEQANKFASDVLIPPVEYARFKETRIFNDDTIKKFAQKINVSAGIIAGRLAHDYGSGKAYRNFEHLRSKIKFRDKST